MSSHRGGGTGQSNKGKNIAAASNFDVNQLNQAVRHVNLQGSSQGGGWEVMSKKNKTRAGPAAAATKPTPWGPPGAQRTSARVDAPVMAPYNAWAARSAAIPPPIQSGWNWNSRQSGNNNNIPNPQPVVEDDDQNEEIDDNSDDDILDDEYDSDEILKTHEERKKNRWYAAFFETLDTLTLEQINEPTRQWHCPACQNGPGAIDWYKSLPSLIAHAKTKGSKRVKIHRDLGVVLEEELRIRGAAINPAGESYGQWKGLTEVVKDKEIVWPPMVVVMNTQLEQDDNNKWIGMGNQELLDYFEPYEAVRARHSYGPRGHMGMSVLIFESSAFGYTEAERLSKHFENEGAARDTWDRHPTLFYPGGKRKLYGFMATKSDMDVFNKHSHGKSEVKFEMVSYQEKVVKEMNEGYQQSQWYKNIAVRVKMHSKAVEESYGIISQRLRESEKQNRIVRERLMQYHEETQEEINYQEQFYQEQLKAKEGRLDQMQHEERVVADSLNRNLKLEEMKEFVEEREELKKLFEEKEAELKSWYDAELTRLGNKYSPE